MKKIIFPLLIAVFAVNACSDHAKQDEKKAQPETAGAKNIREPNTSVRVPLATAQANIRRYDSLCTAIFSGMGGSVPIKAYTVHAADLFESLGMPGSYADSSICKYHHVRVYLGLDSLYSFRLYFTPVTGADLSGDAPIAGKDEILTDSKGNQYVLDLNAPCPNTCDDASPLYNPPLK